MIQFRSIWSQWHFSGIPNSLPHCKIVWIQWQIIKPFDYSDSVRHFCGCQLFLWLEPFFSLLDNCPILQWSCRIVSNINYHSNLPIQENPCLRRGKKRFLRVNAFLTASVWVERSEAPAGLPDYYYSRTEEPSFHLLYIPWNRGEDGNTRNRLPWIKKKPIEENSQVRALSLQRIWPPLHQPKNKHLNNPPFWREIHSSNPEVDFVAKPGF